MFRPAGGGDADSSVRRVAAPEKAQSALLVALEEQDRRTYKRGTVELRYARIVERIAILNQINTQAMLIVGCSSALLSGESLESLDSEQSLFKQLVSAIFVCLATISLAASVWVIYSAQNLIQTAQEASMTGSDEEDVIKVDKLFSERAHFIFQLYLLSLLSFIFCVVLTVLVNMSTLISAMVVLLGLGFTALAVRSERGFMALFNASVKTKVLRASRPDQRQDLTSSHRASSRAGY